MVFNKQSGYMRVKVSLAQPDPLPNSYAEKGSGDNHHPVQAIECIEDRYLETLDG